MEDTSEYKDQAKELKSVKEDLSATQSELESIAGDVPKREKAVKQAEGAVAKREKALQKAEASVAEREAAVGKVEETIEANTIGEGVYEVGVDMKAGTYKSAGSEGCYYAVLNSSDTSDIADNNTTDGPAVVTVNEGQFFENTRCADFVVQ